MTYKLYSKILTSIFVLLLTANISHAQVINGSPYSNYGLGDINTFGFSGASSSGFTSTALMSNRDFSFVNPASNSSLKFAVLKLGATLNNVSQTSETQKGTYSEADLSYLSVGFPILKKKRTRKIGYDSLTGKTTYKALPPLLWGASFGLTPFSRSAYGTNFTTDTTFGSYENIFNGEGGISRVFINNGVKINKNLSLGHSARFLFGSINDYRIYIFPDSLNIKGQQRHSRVAINGFQHTFGAIYEVHGKKYKHNFGVTRTLKSSINSNTQLLVQSMDYNNGILNLEDTLKFESESKSKIDLPSGITLGWSMQKHNRWRLALEYKRENWSEFKWNNTNDSFVNSSEYSIGFILNPDSSRLSFKNLEYRFGLRYKTSYLSFEETDKSFSPLVETGITFGIGIPLVNKWYGSKETTKNMLDFGFEYYTRGKSSAGLVKEDFFNFTVGVTFNDIWFRRRKIY